MPSLFRLRFRSLASVINQGSSDGGGPIGSDERSDGINNQLSCND